MDHHLGKRRHAARSAAITVLLATTCLTPLLVGTTSPAFAGAGGGDGGLTGAPSVSGRGGTGSSGLDDNAGGAAGGTSPLGSGVSGGLPGQDGANNGGNGSGGGGGGGNALSGSFAAGNGGAGVAGGGPGGAGGGAGQVIAGSTTVVAPIAGANGANGTTVVAAGIRGGGGGGGGDGAVLTGSGSVSVQASVQAGAGGGGGGSSSSAAGSGGGGGAAIVSTGGSTLSVTAASSVTGGAGGAGGAAGTVTSGGQSPSGGGGGGGGFGIALSSGGSLNIAAGSQVTGGAGGAGGTGAGNTVQVGGPGGGGGGGGGGIIASGGSITNSGTITGASGGVGGSGGNGAGGTGAAGTAGAGGAGIVGSGITIINSGTITGGSAGGGGAQANAVTFTGGSNTLTLQAGSTLNGNLAVQAGSVTFNQSTSQTLNNVITGAGSVIQNGTGMLTLGGVNTYTGGTTINGSTLAVSADNNLGNAAGGLSFNAGTLQLAAGFSGGMTRPVTLNAGGGTINTNGNNLVMSGIISGGGGLTKNGNGILTFQTAMAYTGGTTVNAGTLFLDSVGGSLPTGGALTVNGGLFDMSDIATGQSVGALAGTGGQINLGANNLTTNSSASTTLATQITGTGALIKQGAGTLTLTGNNLYSGGTQIQGGLVNFNALNNFGTGNITLSGGGLQWTSGSTLDISSRLVLGSGGATFDTNGNNVSFASGLTGTGGLTKQGSGTLNLLSNNTFSGNTTVSGGTLAVNGRLASNTVVGPGGTLGGTGTIVGTVTTQGTVAPGNSIGTLNVTGSFVQAAGSTYQVEANAAGQSDKIAVTGTAAIQGGTVQVLAQPGTYATSTTYTILSTTGGRTGAYSSVTSNFAFLTPSLTYDANNVFLTLALQPGGPNGGGFLMSAFTPNQKAVGYSLNQSFSGATGDYLTVINALASLNAFAGPAALNALSGEQYADFGTMNVNNAALFMGAVGQQMALARGTVAASGQRAALAQACDIAACDGVSPFSVWASGLGGLGAVSGDYNASTATYNFGGAAVGIDYRLDPRFLVGLGVSYTAGNLWVNSFPGKGTTDSVAVAAYGSFTQDGFYADLLGGYGYFYNQAQRQILIPGLQPRTTNGATAANQAMGQVETGYRIGVYQPASATLAPFARLQGSSVTQNGFSESGAQSLSLNVAQQTTNSLRSLFGIDLAGAVPMGSDRTLDLGLRLGWQHEFASTARPITAALSGAPFAAFTVYGATPQPDSAVVSLRASTNLATSTQLYLRYDGDIGSGTDNHAFNVGLRMSW
ncbi:autotransporter-associated beta strand repeat-containing protein [Rhodospirillales bacterium URHD0017]|nr:autotransporter-associated beta strand repeat-containing protein [Rhodospirillales bacterium URHD0017]